MLGQKIFTGFSGSTGGRIRWVDDWVDPDREYPLVLSIISLTSGISFVPVRLD